MYTIHLLVHLLREHELMVSVLFCPCRAGKFLVDHTGTPFKRYTPKQAPVDLKADIEELLKKKES